jgi:hypothetical protein
MSGVALNAVITKNGFGPVAISEKSRTPAGIALVPQLAEINLRHRSV